ncbi:MAG: hypothetical protein OXN89_09285 [Bryobacterales bacterium]|nr:hypothetical protein [Bryobacterales bacterium]
MDTSTSTRRCRTVRLFVLRTDPIWAESAGAGRDTRFTFTLPTEEAVAAPRRARPSRLQEPTRVAVVDDHPQTLRYVCEALGPAG